MAAMSLWQPMAQLNCTSVTLTEKIHGINTRDSVYSRYTQIVKFSHYLVVLDHALDKKCPVG